MRVTWCWSTDGTPEEDLPRLRDCGFDGIELWPAALGKYPVSRWKAALRSAGMQCVQLCPYFDFVSHPYAQLQSDSQLAAFLAAADTLECQRLRVFTGPPWGAGAIGPKLATEQQWANAIKGLQQFCQRCEPQRVELCLEAHEGSLMEDSPNTLRLLSGVNHPLLTVNLQLPLVGEPDWRTSVDALGHAVTHLHMHNHDGPGFTGPWTYLSEGAVDWWPILHALVSGKGRRPDLSAEHTDHGGRHQPWETARRDGPWLRALRDKLLASVQR